MPHCDAAINVEDRGYQLADGVYEVIAIYNGYLIDRTDHLRRLRRSLKELRIELPVKISALNFIMDETIRKNFLVDGKLYLQITRGVAPRDHAFPAKCKSALIVSVSRISWPSRSEGKQGCSVITGPDLRWKRCDIKSVSLLPNVLLRQKAVEANADETWMVDDEGHITEGTASNAWIITPDNELVTRQADESILAGITRKTILQLAKEEGIAITERMFTVEEAQNAKEAFFTSTTALIKPVTDIDNISIGNGNPGLITCTLIDKYFDLLENLSRKE